MAEPWIQGRTKSLLQNQVILVILACKSACGTGLLTKYDIRVSMPLDCQQRQGLNAAFSGSVHSCFLRLGYSGSSILRPPIGP